MWMHNYNILISLLWKGSLCVLIQMCALYTRSAGFKIAYIISRISAAIDYSYRYIYIYTFTINLHENKHNSPKILQFKNRCYYCTQSINTLGVDEILHRASVHQNVIRVREGGGGTIYIHSTLY